MELDHIVPRDQGGPDTIENAIPVCFECHAEIHLYNDRHPRGRKYRPEELRAHKQQWLLICRKKPENLTGIPRSAEVGPLQALVDELEFNLVSASREVGNSPNVHAFETGQLNRAIAEGVLSLLEDELKSAIFAAYQDIKDANTVVAALPNISGMNQHGWSIDHAKGRVRAAKSVIARAHDLLQKFLASEGTTPSA